jgi:hypothetical protein
MPLDLEPFSYLLELRVARLSAAAAIGIVKQRLVELFAFLDVLQEALLDHVRVDRDDAKLCGLLERRFDDHAADILRATRNVARMQARKLVDAGSAIGAQPRQPAPRRLHLDRNKIARSGQGGAQDEFRFLRREAFPGWLLLLRLGCGILRLVLSTVIRRNGFWSSLRRSTMKPAVADRAAIHTFLIDTCAYFFAIR